MSIGNVEFSEKKYTLSVYVLEAYDSITGRRINKLSLLLQPARSAYSLYQANKGDSFLCIKGPETEIIVLFLVLMRITKVLKFPSRPYTSSRVILSDRYIIVFTYYQS